MFWVNYNDLTVLPHWNNGEYWKSSPFMAQQFSLVNDFLIYPDVSSFIMVIDPIYPFMYPDMIGYPHD